MIIIVLLKITYKRENQFLYNLDLFLEKSIPCLIYKQAVFMINYKYKKIHINVKNLKYIYCL